MPNLANLMMAAAALLAQAQPAPPPDRTAVQLASQALQQGRYLDAVDHAHRAAFAGGALDRNSLGYQVWLQTHPVIGGTLDPAAIEQGPFSGVLEPESADRARRAEVRDAVREIVARARGTRLVILNEAHHSPRDRAFGLEVARALRPLGYTMLAAEAFTNDRNPDARSRAMSALARDGYPRRSTGHYMADPIFGDFIRQSLALGYAPVSYEDTSTDRSGDMAERIARREQGQAEALADVVRRNSDAKLLVFVGFSHAAEAPVRGANGANEWMASRLKRLTGIDPLTIDQTVIDETSARSRAYRDLTGERLRGRPGILFVSGSPVVEGQYAGAVDLQVIHPPLRLVRGRPDWMLRMGRRAVAIPRHLLPAKGRRLIQAFAAEEPEDAIPLDQLAVEAGREPPPLMLPRRRIRWAVQDPAVPIS